MINTTRDEQLELPLDFSEKSFLNGDIGIILRFSPQQLLDIVNCAKERGYTECGPMLMNAIEQDLYH
jgi:hypothetical protein